MADLTFTAFDAFSRFEAPALHPGCESLHARVLKISHIALAANAMLQRQVLFYIRTFDRQTKLQLLVQAKSLSLCPLASSTKANGTFKTFVRGEAAALA